MPKPLTPELLAHTQQSQTTLARCVRIERTDGKIIALTDHDQNLIIEGINYQSAVGYTPTAISTRDRGAINSVDIEGILAVAGVSRHDIAAGCFDHARVFVFEVNYQDLSQGILPLLRGFWGECQLHNHHYTTEFRSVSQALQQTVGEHYATHCRAQLGDARCRVDLVPLAIAGIVTEVENSTIFMTAALDHPDAYFQYGLLTWETGANAGISIEIQDSVRQANESLCLNLVEALPQPIAVGDSFILVPGCDKSVSCCQQRFKNVVNFRGEPFIPGLDRVLQY